MLPDSEFPLLSTKEPTLAGGRFYFAPGQHEVTEAMKGRVRWYLITYCGHLVNYVFLRSCVWPANDRFGLARCFHRTIQTDASRQVLKYKKHHCSITASCIFFSDLANVPRLVNYLPPRYSCTYIRDPKADERVDNKMKTWLHIVARWGQIRVPNSP